MVGNVKTVTNNKSETTFRVQSAEPIIDTDSTGTYRNLQYSGQRTRAVANRARSASLDHLGSMILDNALAGEPLRTLRSFIPQPDLRPMCHLDNGTRTFSDEPTRKLAQPPAAAAAGAAVSTTKITFVEAVRLFGGVIIGSAAGEISRNFGGFRQHPALEEVESEQEDVESEPLVASFSASASSGTAAGQLSASLSLQDEGEPSCKAARKAEGVGRRTSVVVSPEETSGLLSSSKYPVTGTKKRKFAHGAAEAVSRSGFAGDATPLAPAAGGREAARAKAKGQDHTSFVSECKLPTDKGQFRLRAYRYAGTDKFHEPVVMVAGDVRGRANVPVRVHDQCQTSEVSVFALGECGGIG